MPTTRRAAAMGALAVLAVGVTIRVVLVTIPFAYVPDILSYDTQAVRVLLAGSNPYGHAYMVPANLATPGAGNIFAYLPGVVEFLTPFGAVTDVRLGLVACDVLVAVALYSMRGRWSWVMGTVYMLLPTSILFSTWYPNDTLVGMAFLGLSISAGERGHGWASSVLLGFAVASSQLVWLLYPFLLLKELRAGRIRESAISILVAAIAVAPFVVWNPSVFFANTVTFEFSRPIESLVTPQPFGVNLNPTLSGMTMTLLGTSMSFALRAGVSLAVLFFLLWKSSTPGKALLYGTVFLLVGIFVLPSNFSWWYLELPLMTLMIWFALSRDRPMGVVRTANP